MRTKRIVLNYSITPTKVVPPSGKELARKDKWIEEIQKGIEAEWKPVVVRVTYEIFNPEIQRMRKFFEGACVPYYLIQQDDMTEGYPSNEAIEATREDILDEMLGYDYQGVKKMHRKRKSTADFKTVQAFNNFLQTLEETIFEAAGYEFPDSKHFWDLVKEHGYDQAKAIVVQQLQERLKKKVDNSLA